MVGQEQVTDVLRHEVATGKTTHAYLFCGSRGTGKTTCAKILAKALNCLSPVDGNPCGKCEACLAVERGDATDIIEMDAASNNGVDYIRDIREEAVYMPALLQKKVYIIDEVHMLSGSAFNALLKTLEEPPEHVVFILATTELQKLPATVISRCQRFDFRRIDTEAIAGRLETIAAKEDIALTHEAAKQIARLSEGGMRDAISLLELCSGSGKTVDVALVNAAAGVAGLKTAAGLVDAVLKKDGTAIFETVASLSASATDLSVFFSELLSFYRDMLLARTVPHPEKLFDRTEEDVKLIRDSASRFTREKLMYHLRLLEEAYLTMQRSASLKRVVAEMALVKMTDEKTSDRTDALLARIAALEEKLASGASFIPAPKKEADGPADGAEPAVEDARGASPAEKPVEKEPSEATDRPIENWIEIVKTVERSDNGAASVLKLAKGFRRGRRVIIKTADEFSRMLLDRKEVFALIAPALNLAGEQPEVSPDDLTVVIEKAQDTGPDPLSELS